MLPSKPSRCRVQTLVITCTLLLTSACGPSPGEPASTQTVAAIYTSAIQTFSAQAVTPPVLTPSPSIPTGASPSPVPSAASSASTSAAIPAACDNSAFIADVTIPDGASVAAGSKFVKTWTLLNTGTCAWTSGYGLSFSSGDQMGGVAVPLPSTVQPGQQADVSVNLVAPTSAGAYKGVWRMHNAGGQAFGDFPYVAITVGTAAVATTACHAASHTSVTISGHAGPENVTINYGDGVVYTDPNGDYSFVVPMGWSGTVIPTKAKVHPWTFNPDHRTYTNLRCDLPHEDYKATPPPGV